MGVRRSPSPLDGTTTPTRAATPLRISHVSAAGTPQSQDDFSNGNPLPDDFKLWLSRHPGLTVFLCKVTIRSGQQAGETCQCFALAQMQTRVDK